MSLGGRIKQIRQQKKMSQIELAEKADIYQKNISRYELDTSIPSATALKKIADALGVSTDYLLGDEDQVIIKDKELLRNFKEVQNLPKDVREVVDTFLNLIIRDSKAKQAYAQ
jgi:transcriptional regulator with XRE-family HTH domain